MADLGATLGKPIGPLPLGAWIAVVGGGLGIAWYANRSQAATPEEPVQLAETGVGEGVAAFIPAAEVTQPVTVESLDEWINKAIVALAGKYSPLQVENALRTYAKGETLTQDQAKIVNLVISTIGPAPAGEITETPTVKPPPTPAPKPVPHKYAFTFTQAPSTFRVGRSIVYKGKLTDNGKPVKYAVIRVSRRNFSNRSWQFYRLVPTSGTGTFGVTVSPYGNSRFLYVRFSYGGITRDFQPKAHS